MVSDDPWVFAAMQAGARGYLLKGARRPKSSGPCPPSPAVRRFWEPTSPPGWSVLHRQALTRAPVGRSPTVFFLSPGPVGGRAALPCGRPPPPARRERSGRHVVA